MSECTLFNDKARLQTCTMTWISKVHSSTAKQQAEPAYAISKHGYIYNYNL